MSRSNDSLPSKEQCLSTSYSEEDDSELLLIQSIMPYFKSKNEIPLILHLQVPVKKDGILSRQHAERVLAGTNVRVESEKLRTIHSNSWRCVLFAQVENRAPRFKVLPLFLILGQQIYFYRRTPWWLVTSDSPQIGFGKLKPKIENSAWPRIWAHRCTAHRNKWPCRTTTAK